MILKIKLIILFVSLVVTLCALFLPGPKQCYNSVKKKPLLAFLMMLLIIAVFLGNPRGVHSIVKEPVDCIRFIRIFVIALVTILSFLVLLFKKSSFSTTGWGVKSLFIYAILAMISALYSSYPLLSLWKGFEVFAFVFFGFVICRYIISSDDILDIINILWVSLLILVLTSLVGILFYPELASMKMLSTGGMAFAFQGVFPAINANTLTQIAGILASLTLINVFSSKRISHQINFFIVFILAVIVMALAHSRTSLLAFAVTLMAILFFLHKQKLFWLSVWLGILMALSGFFVKILLPYFYRGQGTKLFYSMSGRTNFWPIVWSKFCDSPVFGHGFYTAHRMSWGVGSVDNTYLEILLGLGIVGLVFFLLSIIFVSIDFLRTLSGGEDAERIIWLQLLIVFLFLFVRSLTGPSFQILHIDLLYYVVLVVLIHAYKNMGRLESTKLSPSA